jgi:hypothetical protein
MAGDRKLAGDAQVSATGLGFQIHGRREKEEGAATSIMPFSRTGKVPCGILHDRRRKDLAGATS